MLFLSSFIAGALHALAPDHWVPFLAFSRAHGWSVRKTAFVTLSAGMLHVASSLILGLAGIFFGRSVAEVTHWGGLRGAWFSFFMIGFGITYMLWAMKQSNREKMAAERSRHQKRAYWIYFAIFVLGPCEPLIPFLFLSADKGGMPMATVVLLFGTATLTVMTGTACAVSKRFETIKLPSPLLWNPEIGAGAVIALTGLFVRLLGL